MFDWNDEELATIIWGEAGESDDHIVPYAEAIKDLSNKKEQIQEASGTKLTEQNRPEAKIDFHERKLGSSSNLNNSGELPASGYGKNSGHDLSLSSADEIDQSSLVTEVPKNLSEIKFSASRDGEITQLENDAEIFPNSHEGKEHSDFVDYGWANIGSFDDLDRIFSNGDPIFGHGNLDNSDELWSSKDVSNSPASIPLDPPSSSSALRNSSEPEKYVQCNDHAFADVGCAGGISKPTGKEQQAWRQKNLLKHRKKSQIKQERKALQDFHSNLSPSAAQATQFENQLAPSVIHASPTSIHGNQKLVQGLETLNHYTMNPYVASAYGNHTNTYPAMPMLLQTQSGDLRHQPLLSEYKVSPGMVDAKKSVHSFKPQTMTPQEKIEKLRRRQQMQALLAIQKQQRQLSQQVPNTCKSITQKSPLEIQSHLSDGNDPENDDIRTLPSLDPPIEQDDSSTISPAVDSDFLEDTILYRLQDIISKLDIKIRLCIRDSLFRLAQSAKQRHYAGDTSSANKSSREEVDVVARDDSDSQNRYARMADVETETNPIDRTVAHLLFHRPLELTANYYDNQESSAKVQCENKATNLVKLPMRCLPNEEFKNNQRFSHLEFKNSWSSLEAQSMDQIRNSPCMDASENASNTQELEYSQ